MRGRQSIKLLKLDRWVNDGKKYIGDDGIPDESPTFSEPMAYDMLGRKCIQSQINMEQKCNIIKIIWYILIFNGKH